VPWPPDWQALLLWSGALSLLAVVAAIVGVPWVLARLPADYFSQPRREAWRLAGGEPVLARLAGLAKNLLGLVLVVLGVLLVFTPGQGLLTILAGLLLMNFPGKYRLERALVAQPGVLRGLNWLRQRRGRAPFEAPRE